LRWIEKVEFLTSHYIHIRATPIIYELAIDYRASGEVQYGLLVKLVMVVMEDKQ